MAAWDCCTRLRLFKGLLAVSQGAGDQFAEAGQKINTLARMKMIGTVTTDRQKSELRFIPQWDQCHRSDFDVIRAEQKVTLCVPYGTAPSSIGLQKRLEWANALIIATGFPQKLARGINAFAGEQDQYGMICVKPGA